MWVCRPNLSLISCTVLTIPPRALVLASGWYNKVVPSGTISFVSTFIYIVSILCSADHFGPTCLIVHFHGQLYLRRSLSHVYIEAGSIESKDFRPGTETSLSSSIRGLSMLCISMKSSLAQPLPNLSWNVLLTAEHAASKAQHHEPGPWARHRDKLREELVMLMGNCIGGETDIEIAMTIGMMHVNASWLGVPFNDLEQDHLGTPWSQLSIWVLCLGSTCTLRDSLQQWSTCRKSACCMLPKQLIRFPNARYSQPRSSSLQEQAHYLFAMAHVMSHWRGTGNSIWVAKTSQLQWTVDQLCVLEKEIAQLYCQAFYICFWHASITPYHLSPAAVAKNPLVARTHRPTLALHIENNAMVFINSQAAKWQW